MDLHFPIKHMQIYLVQYLNNLLDTETVLQLLVKKNDSFIKNINLVNNGTLTVMHSHLTYQM